MTEENEGNMSRDVQTSRVVAQTDEGAVIKRAQAAVREIEQASLFEKYIDDIGPALMIIRKRAQQAARTEHTDTPAYRMHLRRILHETGLYKIDKGTRSHLLQCMDRLPEIQEWRASLPIEARERLNHPKNVLAAWKKAVGAQDPRSAQKRESLHDANLRLTEENDQLRQAINRDKVFDFRAPFKEQAARIFAENRPDVCQSIGEELIRLVNEASA